MARRQRQSTGKITAFSEALDQAGPRPAQEGSQALKKNYAERLSRCVATCIANALRPRFAGILPSESGEEQETVARSSRGLKKLDVNYSTTQLGLGLGVSIKTLNFRDPRTQRYTKNYSRNDNELRAEATDYHQRQPYAVLVGILYLPFDSCDDSHGAGSDAASSFAQAVKYFRRRTNRVTPRDDIDLFERFFIGLYEFEGEDRGNSVYFDVMQAPPRNRRPKENETFSFDELVSQITRTYDARNDPPFVYLENGNET